MISTRVNTFQHISTNFNMTQFQHKTEFQHKIEFQHDLNKNNNGAPPVSVVL